MLIIGSQALRTHLQLSRNPKDYDVICSHEQFQTFIKKIKPKICYPTNNGNKIIAKTENDIYEFEIAWENSTGKELIDLVNKDFGITIAPLYAPLNVLYTIKMSHRYKKNSPFFLKTMRDIQLMRKHGAYIPSYLKEWFIKREKESLNRIHPNLNQNKKNFFNPNQGIKYVYDHDSIHEVMKHLNKPAYSFFKEDQKEVKCSKSKFENLSKDIQLFSVLEEVYVLALERSQIPFKDQIEPKTSFLISLEKICTSISSGWWREFAWENYDKILELYDENYTNKFWNAVNKGLVKFYE